MYAQWICERNSVQWNGSYKQNVEKLKAINRVLKICEDEYDFVQQLFDIGMPSRYNWLVEKYQERQEKLSPKQRRNVEKLIEHFRKGVCHES